jgi:hypothetical protein
LRRDRHATAEDSHVAYRISMAETRKRKLLWDNACRLYTRFGLD